MLIVENECVIVENDNETETRKLATEFGTSNENQPSAWLYKMIQVLTRRNEELQFTVALD